jgi:hypothetical protein
MKVFTVKFHENPSSGNGGNVCGHRQIDGET